MAKTTLALAATIVALALFGGRIVRADSVTDTTLNVTYTATVASDASDPAGTTDVTLVIDATGFTAAGPGFLTALSLQFTGATAVTLESATGGVSGWTTPQTPGGLNGSDACDSKALGAGFWCIDNISANLAVPASGTFTFVYEVTGLTSDISDIKAAYNAASNDSGHNLGLTSMGIDLTPGTPPKVTEPAGLALLGTGLLVLAGVTRRRLRKA